MSDSDPTERARKLVASPGNVQAFCDLCSDDETWDRIDKEAVKLPGTVAFTEERCPHCDETLRLIYDKFCQGEQRFDVTCPHCSETVTCINEFAGYTSVLTVE